MAAILWSDPPTYQEAVDAINSTWPPFGRDRDLNAIAVYILDANNGGLREQPGGKLRAPSDKQLYSAELAPAGGSTNAAGEMFALGNIQYLCTLGLHLYMHGGR